MNHSYLYKIRTRQVMFLVLMMFSNLLSAMQPVDVLPEYEERYHDLLSELRCLVCQNQTIEESDSELAHDLRFEVNKLLTNGATNSEVIDFMADRYGDFVLYKPLVKPKTYLLWFGPFIFLLVILFLVLVMVRKQTTISKNVLTDDEKNKLDSILKDTKE
jgi:cytochrome c-type biogenesis protein CcmH